MFACLAVTAIFTASACDETNDDDGGGGSSSGRVLNAAEKALVGEYTKGSVTLGSTGEIGSDGYYDYFIQNPSLLLGEIYVFSADGTYRHIVAAKTSYENAIGETAGKWAIDTTGEISFTKNIMSWNSFKKPSSSYKDRPYEDYNRYYFLGYIPILDESGLSISFNSLTEAQGKEGYYGASFYKKIK